MRVFTLLLLTSCFSLSGFVFAEDDNGPIPIVADKFRFSATVSFWAPANQTTGYMNGSALGTLNDSIADNVESASSSAMATLEGHYGRFGLLADWVYWDNNNGQVNHTFALSKKNVVYASAHSDTRQSILTGAATYTAFNDSDWYIDGLIGARYITNDSSVNLDGKYPAKVVTPFEEGLAQSGIVGGITNLTAPIIGIKGRARLYDTDWFIPFYGDIGSAGTAFSNTWQTQLGIARSFDWVEVNLSFRALYFELADGGLHTKNTFFGPSLGVTVNF